MAIEAVGYIRTEKIILKAGLFSKNHIVNVHIDPQTGFTVANYIGRENGNGGLRSSRRINNLERRALEQLKYDPTKVMINIEGQQNQIREPKYFHPRLRTLQVPKLEINDPDGRIEHGATLHAMTYGYTPDVSKHTPDIVLAAMQGQNPESQVISAPEQTPALVRLHLENTSDLVKTDKRSIWKKLRDWLGRVKYEKQKRETTTNYDRAVEVLTALDTNGISHLDITPSELAQKIEKLALDMRKPNVRPSEIFGFIVGSGLGKLLRFGVNLRIPWFSNMLRSITETAARVSLEEEVFERWNSLEETRRTSRGDQIGDIAVNMLAKRAGIGIADVIDAGVQVAELVTPKTDYKGKKHLHGGIALFVAKFLLGLIPLLTSDDASGFIEGIATDALKDKRILPQIQNMAAVIAARQITNI